MLNPDFKLSVNLIMDMLWPEASDPLKERAAVRSDMALNDPTAIQINLMQAFRSQASILEQQGDPEAAELYINAANKLMAQLGQQQPKQPNQQQMITPQQEVMPREAIDSQVSFGGEI